MGKRIHHPNREKAESKATKAIVVLLLLATAGLLLVVTVGGWSKLQGGQIFSVAFVVVYLVMAYYVSRWQRGLLPVASALAVFVAVLAAVGAPSWFARDKEGLANPALDPSLLGLLTLVVIPLQLLLVAFAARGFTQRWNVEIEVDGDGDHHEPDPPQRGGSSVEPLGA